jgi:hypothetical protein
MQITPQILDNQTLLKIEKDIEPFVASFGSSITRTSKMTQLAESIAATLEQRPRQSNIAEALNNPAALAARTLLKNIHKSQNKDPRIIECRKQLLAFKFGLSATILDLEVNQGFQAFASMPPLERYLMEYGHSLRVDYCNHEIKILSSGEYQGWSKLKNTLKPPQDEKGPVERLIYGIQGVQFTNAYDWTELKPYKRDNPADWNHQYIFEFCTCSVNSPRKTGDHTWIRLKTPEGDVYSIGLYRQGKMGRKSENIIFPFRIKKGYMMSPDISEFYPTPIQKTPIAITKEQFLEMKRVIEEDKKNDQLTFQLFHGNCTLYATKIAKIGNIILPTKKSVWRLITPKCLEPVANAILKILPSIVKRVVNLVGSVIINLVQCLLGATKVDPLVLKDHPKMRPHISSIRDIFDSSKAELNHPNTLGHATRKLVMDWRAKETAVLNAELVSLSNDPGNGKRASELRMLIAKIRFDLPPEFRVCA